MPKVLFSLVFSLMLLVTSAKASPSVQETEEFIEYALKEAYFNMFAPDQNEWFRYKVVGGIVSIVNGTNEKKQLDVKRLRRITFDSYTGETKKFYRLKYDCLPESSCLSGTHYWFSHDENGLKLRKQLANALVHYGSMFGNASITLSNPSELGSKFE